jgi:hypothetical protein
MPTPVDLAEKFNSIDAHDETVEGFAFVPAVKRGAGAEVSVVLFRRWENKRRELRFRHCANLEVILDADVLVGNAPSNTAMLEATADVDAVRQAMKRQKRHWNVSYERSIDPLPKKLLDAEKYVLFRVRLFGGALNIVARSFSNKRLTAPSSGQPSAAAHVGRYVATRRGA